MRRRKPAVAVGLDQVFEDGARLGQRLVAVGDDRRLSERMNGAQ